MRCPECDDQVEDGAWICPQCEHILDPSVLGDDITNDEDEGDGALVQEERTKLVAWTPQPEDDDDEIPDAMILGDVGVSEREFSVVQGAVAQGDGRTSTFLFYTGGNTSRIIRPDAIPAVEESESSVPHTPYEDFILSRIDGKQNVREIQKASGLAPQEVVVTLMTLLDKGAIRILPTEPDPDYEEVTDSEVRARPKAVDRESTEEPIRPSDLVESDETVALRSEPDRIATQDEDSPEDFEDLPSVDDFEEVTVGAPELDDATEEFREDELPNRPDLSREYEPAPMPDGFKPVAPCDLDEQHEDVTAAVVPLEDEEEDEGERPTSGFIKRPKELQDAVDDMLDRRNREQKLTGQDALSGVNELNGAFAPLGGEVPRTPAPIAPSRLDVPPAPATPVPIAPSRLGSPTPAPSSSLEDAIFADEPKQRDHSHDSHIIQSAFEDAGLSDRQLVPAPVLDPQFLQEVPESRIRKPPGVIDDDAVRVSEPPPLTIKGEKDTPPKKRTPKPPTQNPTPAGQDHRRQALAAAVKRGPIQEVDRRKASKQTKKKKKKEDDKPLMGTPDPAPAPGAFAAPRAGKVDGPRMHKAKRLFDQALTDQAEGNLVSAKMNMKLALTFDPSNEMYQQAFDELSRNPQAQAQQPAMGRSKARELYDAATEAENHGDIDRAIELLWKAIDESGQAPFYNRLGVILAMKKREYATAQELIEKAIDLAPGNSTYEVNLQKVLSMAASVDVKSRDTGPKKGGILGIFGRRK